MWWIGAALASGQMIGSDGEMILVGTDVQAEVVADVAVVEVHQTFENPYDRAMDATYVFPLPVGAAVQGMLLTCGERVIEGEIQTREAARERYEQALANGQRAALLEQQRANVFTQRVGGLCPGETVEVSLQYVETLPVRDGERTFVFPTTMGDRYDPADLREPPKTAVQPGRSLTLQLEVHAGLPLVDVDSDTYVLDLIDADEQGATIALAQPAVPDADVAIHWRVETEEPALTAVTSRDAEGDAYVALTLHPPLPAHAPDPRPRELVFVLDSSCSMRGEPWEAANETVQTALSALRPGERFNLVRFSSAASAAFEEPVAATDGSIAAAARWMDRFEGGGTNMQEGLLAALEMPGDPEALRLIVLLTDGYIGTEQAFFRAVRDHSSQNDRIFGLGIGSSVNRLLIDGLAHHGRGAAFYQLPDTPIEDTIRDLYRRIDRPVLTDVQVDFEGIEVDLAGPPEDLFVGQPLQVAGRVVQGRKGTVVVRGTLGNAPWSTRLPLDLDQATLHEAVPTIWARERIAAWQYDLDANAAQQEERIGALGLRHHLVSPYTSLVAVDSMPTGCLGATGVDVPVFVPRDTEAPLTGGVGGLIGTKMGSSHGMGGLGVRGAGIGGGGSVGAGRSGSHGYGSGGGSFGAKGENGNVAMGDAIVLGSLDRSLIDQVIRRHLNQIRYCYQRELAKDATLAGAMKVRFTVGADGSVSAVSDDGGTLPESVRACVRGRFERMRFPKPQGGGTIEVRYPLVFRAR